MSSHKSLLEFYREYIDHCIENTTEKDPIHPMSFARWIDVVYIPMKESMKKLLEKIVKEEAVVIR